MSSKILDIPAIKNPIKRRGILLILFLVAFPGYLLTMGVEFFFDFWLGIGRSVLQTCRDLRYDIRADARRIKAGFITGWYGDKD